MVRLSLTEPLHPGFHGWLVTAGIPAFLRVRTHIEITFRDLFDRDYVGRLDPVHRAAIEVHPVLRIGGDSLVASHVSLRLALIDDRTLDIVALDYFMFPEGWRPMVVDGRFAVPEREPDPEWLTAPPERPRRVPPDPSAGA